MDPEELLALIRGVSPPPGAGVTLPDPLSEMQRDLSEQGVRRQMQNVSTQQERKLLDAQLQKMQNQRLEEANARVAAFNPQDARTQDLGGASPLRFAQATFPGEPVGRESINASARAMAPLILGGGSASVEGRPLFGGSSASLIPPRPVDPNFQRVLDTAHDIADSLTPARAGKVETKNLLPNPYGPGSYDPNDPTAVAKIQAQKARQEKISGVQDVFASGILDRLPKGAPTGDIVKSLLESTGLVKSEAQKAKELAQAKAEGERAGGKGKAAIPQEVLNAVGTPDFQSVLTAAVADGSVSDPNVQLRLNQQNEAALKGKRVESTDRRLLTGLSASKAAVEDLASAYKATPAFKTGKFSDSLKAALSLNSKATTLLEFSPLSTEGLSTEDANFATAYNTVMARLRDFSGDTRFSNEDAVRTMKAIGNPLTGPKVFGRQLERIAEDLERRRKFSLEDIKDTGRDVSKLEERAAERGAAKPGAAKAAPAVGTVVEGWTFKGGDPAKRENWSR